MNAARAYRRLKEIEEKKLANRLMLLRVRYLHIDLSLTPLVVLHEISLAASFTRHPQIFSRLTHYYAVYYILSLGYSWN